MAHSIPQLVDMYYDAVIATDNQSALQTIEDALSRGAAPEQLVFEVVLPSLDRLMMSLARNDNVSLSQHFIAAKTAQEIVDRLLPKFSVHPASSGTIVLGTAQGDFHGLGKKIVRGCLTANMFTVHDLGLNVDASSFVAAAVSKGASVIGVSSMMMHTTAGENGPGAVARILKEKKLSDRIKLIVGGAPYRFDDRLYKQVHADAYAPDAMSAVGEIKALMKETQHA